MPREKLLREKSNDLVAAIRFAPPGVIHGPQPVATPCMHSLTLFKVNCSIQVQRFVEFLYDIVTRMDLIGQI